MTPPFPGETRRWLVPVTVIEYGRTALVEASTRAEAAFKARRGDWLEGGDPLDFRVTVVGKAT